MSDFAQSQRRVAALQAALSCLGKYDVANLETRELEAWVDEHKPKPIKPPLASPVDEGDNE